MRTVNIADYVLLEISDHKVFMLCSFFKTLPESVSKYRKTHDILGAYTKQSKDIQDELYSAIVECGFEEEKIIILKQK